MCWGGKGHGKGSGTDTFILPYPSSRSSLFVTHRDVKPPRLVEHIAVLAALRGVPFFVLPKATTSLGRSLGLQRIAALGFRAIEGAAKGSAQRGKRDEGERVDEMEEDVVSGVQNRLQSFQAFLLAKREYVNGEEGLVVEKEGKGERERRT
jgi:ribosomal protein L7Ae-like RNA K-turn-binding protein